MTVSFRGRIRDLIIEYEKGEKRGRGPTVIYSDFPWYHLDFETNLEMRRKDRQRHCYVDIYPTQSERLRSQLRIANSDEVFQPIIDRYADLTSLAIIEMHHEDFYFEVMLPLADFNYFVGFVETNLTTDVNYSMDIPFRRFPEDVPMQARMATLDEPEFVPLETEFLSGKPCSFPNAEISFSFYNRRDDQD